MNPMGLSILQSAPRTQCCSCSREVEIRLRNGLACRLRQYPHNLVEDTEGFERRHRTMDHDDHDAELAVGEKPLPPDAEN